MAGLWLYSGYSAVQFWTYEWLRRSGSSTGAALNGAVAASVATLAVYPFDLLRTRVALRRSPQPSRLMIPATLQSLVEVVRTEGPRGLYRGVGPSLGQIVPSMAIAFGTYERCRPLFTKSPDGLADLGAGALAGFLQKTLMMPVDVVRKRLQIQGSAYHYYVLTDLPIYSGIGDAVKKIWLHDGLLGFYRGLSLALLKSVPVTASTFLIYGLMDRV